MRLSGPNLLQSHLSPAQAVMRKPFPPSLWRLIQDQVDGTGKEVGDGRERSHRP